MADPPMSNSIEAEFARRLAANDKKTRDRAIRKLRQFMNLRSQKLDGGFTRDEMLRIWKGLFYCMWMSDKPLVQEELAKTVSELMLQVTNIKTAMLFFETFLTTLEREWKGIDRLRMDKFYLLVRWMLNRGFEFLKLQEWNEGAVDWFVAILKNGPVSHSAPPIGIHYHVSDIFVEELSKVSKDSISKEMVTKFIDPYCIIMTKSKNFEIVKAVKENVFQELIENSGVALAALKAEEEEFADSGGHSQLEATDTSTPLQVDYKAVADRLFELASKDDVLSRNRKKAYSVVKQLRELADGRLPLDNIPDIDYFSEDELIKTEEKLVETLVSQENEELIQKRKKMRGRKRKKELLRALKKEEQNEQSERDMESNNNGADHQEEVIKPKDEDNEGENKIPKKKKRKKQAPALAQDATMSKELGEDFESDVKETQKKKRKKKTAKSDQVIVTKEESCKECEKDESEKKKRKKKKNISDQSMDAKKGSVEEGEKVGEETRRKKKRKKKNASSEQKGAKDESNEEFEKIEETGKKRKQKKKVSTPSQDATTSKEPSNGDSIAKKKRTQKKGIPVPFPDVSGPEESIGQEQKKMESDSMPDPAVLAKIDDGNNEAVSKKKQKRKKKSGNFDQTVEAKQSDHVGMPGSPESQTDAAKASLAITHINQVDQHPVKSNIPDILQNVPHSEKPCKANKIQSVTLSERKKLLLDWIKTGKPPQKSTKKFHDSSTIPNNIASAEKFTDLQLDSSKESAATESGEVTTNIVTQAHKNVKKRKSSEFQSKKLVEITATNNPPATSTFFKHAASKVKTAMKNKHLAAIKRKNVEGVRAHSPKRVAFEMSKMQVQPFRKTDKSIAVSPSPNSIAFDPRKKPNFGLLKTRRHSTGQSLKRRGQAADFF